MQSKTNKQRQINSKKKYKGGSKCTEVPYIWLNDVDCLINCPEGTCRSYNINDEFICRPLKKPQKDCIITNIELTDNATLYNSDGYLFTDLNNINSLYYGKIIKTIDEIINKDGLRLLIWKNGNIYDGEWKDDEQNGKGKYIDKKNGDVYDGMWEYGFKNRQGTQTTPDYKYEGIWKDGF